MSARRTPIFAPTPANIRLCGQAIGRGELVAFPTETVYGLGANALDLGAAQRIYAAKGRPSDNPLIVHIADWQQVETLVKRVPEQATLLAQTFLPGPLTLVMQKSDAVPDATTGGLDTVAVRLPAHPVARALIAAAGVPVAAPSANLSGRPSPTTAEHVSEDMDGRIWGILGQGDVPVGGLESTIVDVSGPRPVLLRPGFVTPGQLRAVLGELDVDPVITALAPCAPDVRPKAPGMKYRHYAPRAPLTLVRGTPEAVQRAIVDGVRRAKAQGQRAGVLCTAASAAAYREADLVLPLGDAQAPEQIAATLFDALRTLDAKGVQVAFSECFFGDDIRLAIMNRLVKASGYHLIEV